MGAGPEPAARAPGAPHLRTAFLRTVTHNFHQCALRHSLVLLDYLAHCYNSARAPAHCSTFEAINATHTSHALSRSAAQLSYTGNRPPGGPPAGAHVRRQFVIFL